jgi:periplasmic protein TonB
MDVSDVLRDRKSERQGLDRMVMLSVVAHGVLIGTILALPRGWGRHAEAPHAVMTIVLGGGTAGPSNGGVTPIGGRPVQEAKPPDEPKRPEPVRPPAAKTPEMTLPAPHAKPARPAPVPVQQAPNEARGRTPTRGPEPRAGSALAETGERGQGFGLATGGGAGSGSYLDVANFCCPEYIADMTDRIRRNWNPNAEITGEVLVKFTIQRDGTITDRSLEQSSGNQVLDITAERAVAVTRQLRPLPAAFTNPTLTVHLSFQYQR